MNIRSPETDVVARMCFDLSIELYAINSYKCGSHCLLSGVENGYYGNVGRQSCCDLFTDGMELGRSMNRNDKFKYLYLVLPLYGK